MAELQRKNFKKYDFFTKMIAENAKKELLCGMILISVRFMPIECEGESWQIHKAR